MTDRYGNSLYEVNRRVRYSQRDEKRAYLRKERYGAVPLLPRQLVGLTRSEIIMRAQRELDVLRGRPRTCQPPHTWSERLQALASIATLRAAAIIAQPPPEGANIRWYASACYGRRHVLLAGPFLTQRDALANLPRARAIATERYVDAAFAGFGTAAKSGARFAAGRLNADFGLPTGETVLPTAAAA